MRPFDTVPWTRRAWLARTTAALTATVSVRRAHALRASSRSAAPVDAATAARVAAQAECVDPGPLQALAQRAIEAARTAGARYADARLTRSVGHVYKWHSGAHVFWGETEVQGFGVRALVDGYWGFAAACFWDPEAVVHLAQDAVAQATINAKVSAAGSASRGASGSAGRRVELAPVPAATGTWRTPVAIDPFTVSVEEKLDHLRMWDTLAHNQQLMFPAPLSSSLTFVRQECVLATSEGTLVTQTTYETGGDAQLQLGQDQGIALQGLGTAARGWELVLEAKIPEQIAGMLALMAEQQRLGRKGSPIGRYTLVCDGATMAAFLADTLGTATQLDRALGYEANATGTSYLTNPLGMLGTFPVASPLVTVTANRSTPTQLGTIGWDAEGVVPESFTLVKDGVLTDFQTTREQASWLAPYYAKVGRPVRSHGCAAAEDALVLPLQMPPNFALASSASATSLDDLTATVKDGLLITNGSVTTDFQGRTGLLFGTMREIKNGRLGRPVMGGAIQFNTVELWKKIAGVGGPVTTGVIGRGSSAFILGGHGRAKGQPAQATSYSVQAVAALIPDQPLINPSRKA